MPRFNQTRVNALAPHFLAPHEVADSAYADDDYGYAVINTGVKPEYTREALQPLEADYKAKIAVISIALDETAGQTPSPVGRSKAERAVTGKRRKKSMKGPTPTLASGQQLTKKQRENIDKLKMKMADPKFRQAAIKTKKTLELQLSTLQTQMKLAPAAGHKGQVYVYGDNAHRLAGTINEPEAKRQAFWRGPRPPNHYHGLNAMHKQALNRKLNLLQATNLTPEQKKVRANRMAHEAKRTQEAENNQPMPKKPVPRGRVFNSAGKISPMMLVLGM